MQSVVRMYLCDCQEADSVTRLHSERFGSLFCLTILQVSELCPEFVANSTVEFCLFRVVLVVA